MMTSTKTAAQDDVTMMAKTAQDKDMNGGGATLFDTSIGTNTQSATTHAKSNAKNAKNKVNPTAEAEEATTIDPGYKANFANMSGLEIYQFLSIVGSYNGKKIAFGAKHVLKNLNTLQYTLNGVVAGRTPPWDFPLTWLKTGNKSGKKADVSMTFTLLSVLCIMIVLLFIDSDLSTQ